jgi:GNAT superfamily N-acetyltransferase
MKLIELFTLLPDNEIFFLKEDFASDPAITIPSFKARYAKVVGTYDGLEVWGSRFFGAEHDTYAFREKNTTLAFVVVSSKKSEFDAYPLERIWTNPKHLRKGYATALILFLTQKLHNKLLISKDDKLTQDSWGWLIKSVEKNRLKVLDVETKELVSIEKLKNELNQKQHTSTSLIIETTMGSIELFGTGYRILREMPIIITENSFYE